MTNILSTLQAAIVERLETDEWFSGPVRVPVLSMIEGDIGNKVERLQKRTGTCVVVDMPMIERAAEPRRVFVLLSIMVYENVAYNAKAGTQRAALDSCMTIWELLDQWQPAAYWSPLLPQQIVEVATDPWLVYEVGMLTSTVIIASTS